MSLVGVIGRPEKMRVREIGYHCTQYAQKLLEIVMWWFVRFYQLSFRASGNFAEESLPFWSLPSSVVVNCACLRFHSIVFVTDVVLSKQKISKRTRLIFTKTNKILKRL